MRRLVAARKAHPLGARIELEVVRRQAADLLLEAAQKKKQAGLPPCSAIMKYEKSSAPITGSNTFAAPSSQPAASSARARRTTSAVHASWLTTTGYMSLIVTVAVAPCAAATPWRLVDPPRDHREVLWAQVADRALDRRRVGDHVGDSPA